MQVSVKDQLQEIKAELFSVTDDYRFPTAVKLMGSSREHIVRVP